MSALLDLVVLLMQKQHNKNTGKCVGHYQGRELEKETGKNCIST